jgi:hypothetical protein
VESTVFNCFEKSHISSQEETMASKLTEFLFAFGDDSQQLLDFEKDPKDVMNKAGLSPDQQDLILKRNIKGIRAHLHADPDLRQALGVPADQPLPARLPIFVFPPNP